MTGKNLEL